jgi:nucleotide-binding universal stress UspA family protein
MAMLRSILVPVDGSPFSEQALPWALALCRASKANLRLVLVHHGLPAPESLEAERLHIRADTIVRKEERDYLIALVKRIKESGYSKVTRAVLTGQPGAALVEHVTEWGASLVVMSTHGRGPLARAWLGSVADYLVRHLTVPVFLVRPSKEQPSATPADLSNPIIVPLDGSTLGEAVLEPVSELCRLFGAELKLLEVVQPVALAVGVMGSFPVDFDGHLTETWRKEAQDYLDDLVEQLKAKGLRASGAAALGESVYATILEQARGPDGKIIALATSGRGGFRRLALGSVADKVVRAADHPVLVCPGKGRREGRSASTSPPSTSSAKGA